MQQDITHLPGYRVNDYQLVLVPHEDLRIKIMKVKQEFAETYKTAFSVTARPQLPLIYFTQYEMMEERLINRFRNIALGQYPFRVEFRDFGSFPSHTIYINVSTRVPVQDLVRQLRQDSHRLMKFDAEHKPHFITEPHLSIGVKLKPWQYEKGWLEYSHRHFSGKFVADSMVLMKRPAGQLKYMPVEVFSFQNMPVATRQGELFR